MQLRAANGLTGARRAHKIGLAGRASEHLHDDVTDLLHAWGTGDLNARQGICRAAAT